MFKFINDFFCSHDYEKINQFTTKSEMDIFKANKVSYDIASRSTVRYVVTDYKCIYCGQINRLKEKEGK